jgi:hypothetical protein
MIDPIKTLGLTQGKAEHGAQRQCRRDRQGGIARLAAGRDAPLGVPRGDRRLAEPDREAAALAQGRVIRRPVRHLISLSRNMAAAILVRFERHDGLPNESAAYLTSQGVRSQPGDPCTKLLRHQKLPRLLW